MTEFPGTFPGSFKNFKLQQPLDSTNRSVRAFMDEIPKSQEFQFTPKTQPLYPNLEHLNKNTNANTNFRLDEECKKLGFSKKLSNNVLRELDERVAGKGTSEPTTKSVLSPRGSRFNSSHNIRFSKMDSISSHYAATRNRLEHSEARGFSRNNDEMELDKENIPSYDPYSKRKPPTVLQSSMKRRKTAVDETQSSFPASKSSKNLQSILKREGLYENTKIPGSSSQRFNNDPNLTSLSNIKERGKSNISNSSEKVTPSYTMNRNPKSRTLTSSSSQKTFFGPLNPAPTRKLIRSSTLHNLTKPTASSLLKSESYRALKNIIDEPPKAAKTLSKSKSVHNLKLNASYSNKPVWR